MTSTGIDDLFLVITMPDGSRWKVPVGVIALDRAAFYSSEFNGNIERSLREDTAPLFEDDIEIKDWAANNMNWEDVVQLGSKIRDAAPVDYQEGWINGEQEIVHEE